VPYKCKTEYTETGKIYFFEIGLLISFHSPLSLNWNIADISFSAKQKFEHKTRKYVIKNCI